MYQKSYTRKASGAALMTTRKRSKEQDLKLFGTCSSPYVQRVWIALEAKNIPYQYIEVDPFKKPAALLEISPSGPVPTLRHGSWGCSDSTVLLEYLDDLGIGVPLLPSDPCLRATARLWADHVNRAVAPAFYAVLQFNQAEKTMEAVTTLQNEINKMVEAADVEGPFFLGATLGHVDVVFAPWMLRCSRVLKKFRGWPDPEPGSRWERWVAAVEGCEAVRATCCGDDVYEDTFARWQQGKGTEVEDGGFGVP
jgi:glutathione S-transferase